MQSNDCSVSGEEGFLAAKTALGMTGSARLVRLLQELTSLDNRADVRRSVLRPYEDRSVGGVDLVKH